MQTIANNVTTQTSQRTLRTLALTLTFAVASAVTLSAQTQYVHKDGSFSPDGTLYAAFSKIGAAVCNASAGDEIRIGPGNYDEWLTFDEPLELTAPAGGVTIGEPAASQTSLSVISFNTHLFGSADVPFYNLTWLDPERAGFIASHYSTSPFDIIGLQEVWDTALGNSIQSNTWPNYQHRYFGTSKKSLLQVLHSGLLLLSKHQLYDNAQVYFSDGVGTDFFASKSFTRHTIYKDGFGIGVFHTHMQAGTNDSERDKRAEQLAQLGAAIEAYRITYPSHVVVALGDFNVIADSAEYDFEMNVLLGDVAGIKDGAPNVGCDNAALLCTSCSDNPLGAYFGGADHDWRLDYVLYASSRDGTREITPTGGSRSQVMIPGHLPPLSYDGLTTRHLSDHYAVVMFFEISVVE